MGRTFEFPNLLPASLRGSADDATMGRRVFALNGLTLNIAHFGELRMLNDAFQYVVQPKITAFLLHRFGAGPTADLLFIWFYRPLRPWTLLEAGPPPNPLRYGLLLHTVNTESGWNAFD